MKHTPLILDYSINHRIELLNIFITQQNNMKLNIFKSSRQAFDSSDRDHESLLPKQTFEENKYSKKNSHVVISRSFESSALVYAF